MFLPALYENKQLYDVQIVDMTFFHFYGRPYSQCIDVIVIFLTKMDINSDFTVFFLILLL